MDSDGFFVTCLCAEWCGTCREYRPVFEAQAAAFPAVGFRWFDIEEHADEMGDLDIVDFPTILLCRGDRVLFFGPILPQPGHFRRLLETFMTQTFSESCDYAISTPERCSWQENQDIAGLCRLLSPHE